MTSGLIIALADGLRCRSMMLSCKANTSLTDAKQSWRKLSDNLRHQRFLSAFASVVEWTGASNPHVHVLTTGEYVEQAHLSRLAQRAGFGRYSWIEAVRKSDVSACTNYMVKALPDLPEIMPRLGLSSIRPVSLSSSWQPSSLELARGTIARLSGEPPPGPFLRLVR